MSNNQKKKITLVALLTVLLLPAVYIFGVPLLQNLTQASANTGSIQVTPFVTEVGITTQAVSKYEAPLTQAVRNLMESLNINSRRFIEVYDELTDVVLTRRPMVALTFDDGPSEFTDLILDILIEHEARATFCVLGSLVERGAPTLQRMVEHNMEIVGHSWDHTSFIDLNDEQIRRQVTRTADEIQFFTQTSLPPLMRLPYGAGNPRVTGVLRMMGYSMLSWTLDPRDWEIRNVDAIYDNIMNAVTDGSIILLHDIHLTTYQAMYRVIPSLIEAGFELVTASELIAVVYGDEALVPGKTYRGTMQ